VQENIQVKVFLLKMFLAMFATFFTSHYMDLAFLK